MNVKINEFLSADTDGQGGITIEAVDGDSAPLTLSMSDTQLDVLIRFLSATWTESRSKAERKRVVRPLAVDSFQVGRLADGSPFVRIVAEDGLPIDLAMFPGGDVEVAQYHLQKFWEQVTAPVRLPDQKQ